MFGRIAQRTVFGLFVVSFVFLFCNDLEAQDLHQKLMQASIDQLCEEVLAKGRVNKGAQLFSNSKLTCIQCHNLPGPQLAPSLSIPTRKFASKKENLKFVIDSILQPSKHIANGFKTGVFLNGDGEVITGLVKGKPSETESGGLSFDLLTTGKETKIQKFVDQDIESWKISPVSSMPPGLVNNLKDQQQFYDLVKYLHYIQMNGPKAELRSFPMSTFFPVEARKAYEANIDHSGMIGDLGKKQFRQGQRVFQQHCASCHGPVGKEGLMPTSLRFDSGNFKNGSDPYSMYQTLTDGYGLMTAQHQLVPSQKYAVIHFIRQHYVKPHNDKQYREVDDQYLKSLPKGTSRGPEGNKGRRWLAMDYGDHLINTLEVGRDGSNIAQKGIAIRLDEGDGGVAKGRYWALFEHDTLRLAVVWRHDSKSKHRFIDWNGIHFNDRHAVHPRISGKILLQNKTAPGWSDPSSGSFVDDRQEGRDGRRYGPLRNDWGRFKGILQERDGLKILYRIGEADVKESYHLFHSPNTNWIRRRIEIQKRKFESKIQLADAGDGRLELISDEGKLVFRLVGAKKRDSLLFCVTGDIDGAKVEQIEDRICFVVPRGEKRTVDIQFLPQEKSQGWQKPVLDLDSMLSHMAKDDSRSSENRDSEKKPEGIEKEIVESVSGGFEIQTFQLPDPNPWNDRLRLTGLDFLPGGDQMVVCCWDGTVWRVDGIMDRKTVGSESDQGKSSKNPVRWTRIAEGLFQPLGIKVRDGEVFVTCRDQIVQLTDNDGDGLTDFYKSFNSDHQVTEHFHEFAMGLQTDDQGNFYYAKSARHAKKALVPHHGTLLKVAKDGSSTEILAKGFRAANGVSVNPDGSFLVTDQEGHWNPKNRINWVTPGGFYGNMWGYHGVTDSSDSAMDQPVSWITNKFDRSPGELLWCDSAAWGPLKNHFMNLSYGEGRIYLLLPQNVDGVRQGGLVPLPIPAFPTGVMRGRIHPKTGDLYCCGMFAWAGNRQKPGGLYRVRPKKKPATIPVDMKVYTGEIFLTFSDKLEEQSATDKANYVLKTWSLRRSANYGSPHLNNKELQVQEIRLLPNQKTVRLAVKDLKPTMGMEIRFRLKTVDGNQVLNLIHNTIHRLKERESE